MEKIYFNKYEMVEAGDVDTMRTKYVNMLSLLNAMRVDGTDGTQSIQPKAQELFDDMAEMLSENIHNETGALEELTMQI